VTEETKPEEDSDHRREESRHEPLALGPSPDDRRLPW
jgi:hypothetical protein